MVLTVTRRETLRKLPALLLFGGTAAAQGPAGKPRWERSHQEWSEITRRAAAISQKMPKLGHPEIWAEIEPALRETRGMSSLVQIVKLNNAAGRLDMHPANLLVGLLQRDFFEVRHQTLREFQELYHDTYLSSLEQGQLPARKGQTRDALFQEAEKIYRLTQMAEEYTDLNQIVLNFRRNVGRRSLAWKAIRGVAPYHYPGSAYSRLPEHNADF